MKRLVMLLIVVFALGLVTVGTTGCEEQSTGTAAADLGVQEGRRPKDKEKRPAPGPQESGFQEGDANAQSPDDEPGDNDGGDD